MLDIDQQYEIEPLLGAAAAMLMEPTKTAILIIDIQNDFMEGGSLQVPGANFSSYLGACEGFLKFARDSSFVIAQSRDCHPPGHSSFASSHPGKELSTLATLTRNGEEYQQMMWPDHCVQGTQGVELVMPALDDEIVQNKGGELDVDSYSAFIDDAGEVTGLGATLKAKGVTNVIMFGLATDFCVWFSCKNAKELGFNVAVVPELSRGIAAETDPALALTALPSGDEKVFSWAQYRDKGVHILPLGDIKAAWRMLSGSAQEEPDPESEAESEEESMKAMARSALAGVLGVGGEEASDSEGEEECSNSGLASLPLDQVLGAAAEARPSIETVQALSSRRASVETAQALSIVCSDACIGDCVAEEVVDQFLAVISKTDSSGDALAP